MACQRDRIIKLKDYIESFGIKVNIGKNKARGNRGVFINKGNLSRIDVSQCINYEDSASVLVHEFFHYLHYKNDRTMKSLDFSFGKTNDVILEELINVTVQFVPKTFATSLFDAKSSVLKEISELTSIIKSEYPNFNRNKPFPEIERNIRGTAKFLLKYDRIKMLNKVVSIDNIDVFSKLSKTDIYYLKLKSKQRMLRRIDSRINKYNRYYNSPSELLARFAEMYFTRNEKARSIAPNACTRFDETIKRGEDNTLSELSSILLHKS